MSQVLVRNLDAETVMRLKARAKRNGRSLESELRHVLQIVAGMESESLRKRLVDIQAQFKGKKFSDSAALIRRDRSR